MILYFVAPRKSMRDWFNNRKIAMKEIYSLIDNFDIWSALELCQEKHPVYYQNILLECGLLNELVSYLHNSNLKHQFEKENMGGGRL